MPGGSVATSRSSRKVLDWFVDPSYIWSTNAGFHADYALLGSNAAGLPFNGRYVTLTDRSRADSMVERDPTNNDTLHTPEECETIGVRLTSADDLNDHAPLISVG